MRRMHIPVWINSLRTLRRAGCRGTRMGINQVPIDFEPYNLFPSPLPLSACYYGNIEDATAAFLARFATKGVDFRFYRLLRRIRANPATLDLETLCWLVITQFHENFKTDFMQVTFSDNSGVFIISYLQINKNLHKWMTQCHTMRFYFTRENHRIFYYYCLLRIYYEIFIIWLLYRNRMNKFNIDA